MTIYTAEAGNRPVAAMQAASLREAEIFFLSGSFTDELRALEMKGRRTGGADLGRRGQDFCQASLAGGDRHWQKFRATAISKDVATRDDEAFESFLDAVREIRPRAV